MTPVRLPTRAYWASGGVIVGRCGPLTTVQASALLRFYRRQALACHDHGDHDAVICCLALAADLAVAIVNAADWARAASGDRGLRPGSKPCGK